MKPVTVIIPSYTPDDTVRGYEARCLKAVADHTPRELYDLVVVGGRDWSFPQKVNAAAQAAKTEYICVLSNDVFVGPSMWDIDGKRSNWLADLIRSYKTLHRCGVLAPDEICNHREFQEPQQDEHWWALVLIKRSIFWLVGGLDESLPRVYHDQNFSIQLKKHAMLSWRTPDVLVEHVGMATRSRIGEGDSAEERAEMIRRYGVAELRDYVRMDR